MGIVILDLKWSYGIEAITSILYEQLGKRCEVTVISATESRLPYSVKVAKSRTYNDMLLALFNPFVYFRIVREMRRKQPQIAYIVSPHILNVPVCVLFKLFCNVCVISHVHDPQSHRADGIASVARNAVALFQSKYSDRIYCWGNTIGETIAERFKVPAERIAVFRHGPGQRTRCDDLAEEDTTQFPPKYFTLIGNLRGRKGIEIFLEAARLFNERHGPSAVRFLLAGSGDLEKYRHGIDQVPNLLVHNRFMEIAEINEFLAASYASVLPYTGGMLQSSFVAIAYGNGCPVIVSNVGSLPEEVEAGRTGYVVEQSNAMQTADAMTAIYYGRRESFVANCLRAYREKFSWDRIGEEFYWDMERSVAEQNPARLARKSNSHADMAKVKGVDR